MHPTSLATILHSPSSHFRTTIGKGADVETVSNYETDYMYPVGWRRE